MQGRTQLARIKVSSLFGLFTHTVTLATEERITILHGPNGVGKTVILTLIDDFFAGRFEALQEVDFHLLEIELTDGRSLLLRRLLQIGAEAPALEFTGAGLLDIPYIWTRDRTRERRLAEVIDDEVPFITRIGEDLWSDDRTGELYNVPQLIRKFNSSLPSRLQGVIEEEPSWLSEFRNSIRVHFVQTQRLFSTETNVDPRRYRRAPQTKSFASTVTKYSEALKGRIAAALSLYAEHSQALDRSFPQRMLGGPRMEALDTDDLKQRMVSLEKRRVQLKEIGLIEDDASYPFDISTLDTASSTQKAVMTLYVEDTESKLSVLDDLEKRVHLLLGSINRKFRPNKRLRADRTSGLQVRNKKNNRIELTSLSSGEQHELVLIYDLLFQVAPSSLVLIDEPELSLHLTWQKAFLGELLPIVKAVDFDVILATHSPFIVGDRSDLMVTLSPIERDDQLVLDGSGEASV